MLLKLAKCCSLAALMTLGLILAAAPAAAITRHYYVAAEDVVWDFAPAHQDLTHGGPIPRPWTNYTAWRKTRYVEYADATFSSKKPQPEWLGILGPIIRAEVGDTVQVHFPQPQQPRRLQHASARLAL